MLEARLGRRKSCCARRRWLSHWRNWCRTAFTRWKRGQYARGHPRLQLIFVAQNFLELWNFGRSWSNFLRNCVYFFAQGEGLEGGPATDGERWEEYEGQAESEQRHHQEPLAPCHFVVFFFDLLIWKAVRCESHCRIVSACWRVIPSMNRPCLNTRRPRRLWNHTCWKQTAEDLTLFSKQVYQ